MIEKIAFPISTNSAAAGTARSRVPIEGKILEWVCSGSTGTALFGPGATATFTVTRDNDGGTVLALTAVSAPFTRSPRRQISTEAGVLNYYATGSATWENVADPTGIPSADYLTAVITQGGTSVSGTVHMLYDSNRGG